MNRSLLFCGFIAACLAFGSPDTHAQLGESAEIKFNSADAAPLRAKADELGSVVRIYEYLRNNAEYALYHGARSGSINSDNHAFCPQARTCAGSWSSPG